MATTTRCARCGTEIGAGNYLCARCREEEGPSVGTRIRPPSDLERRAERWPAWMPKPSPVQYHATVMAVIVLALAGLGLFAFLSHRGVGPFVGRTLHTQRVPPTSLVVVAEITNEGSKTARANCRLVALVDTFTEAAATRLTGEIPPGGSVRVRQTLHGVVKDPTTVTVNCS